MGFQGTLSQLKAGAAAAVPGHAGGISARPSPS